MGEVPRTGQSTEMKGERWLPALAVGVGEVGGGDGGHTNTVSVLSDLKKLRMADMYLYTRKSKTKSAHFLD